MRIQTTIRELNKPATIIAGILSCITLSSAIILADSMVVASDTAVDDINITVPASCTLTDTVGSGEEHTASMMNGQYLEDLGTTNLAVFCNSPEGYAIYAIGYSNDLYGNTDMLTSNTDVSSNITTSTATSGDNSAWAMKLTSVAGTITPTIENGFDNYSSVPASYTKVATISPTTDKTSQSSLQSTYAVYISPTQGAATYTGKVKYTVVQPNNADAPTLPVDAEAGFISYNPNASGVADTMGNQPANDVDYDALRELCRNAGGNILIWSENDNKLVCRYNSYQLDTIEISEYPTTTKTKLWPSNFRRPGYGFAGWNTEPDYSGTTFGPNEAIDTSDYDVENQGLSLYAIWIQSTGTLQNWNGCSSLGIGDVTALTDSRDNNTYAIAKLADGRCWMIENMRLNHTTALSPQDTDSPFVISGQVSILNENNQTSDHLSSPNNIPGYWCSQGDNAYNCVSISRISTENTTNSPAIMTHAYNSNAYSHGNYYNWYSATAANGTFETTNKAVAAGSICPIGWKLPTAGNTTPASDYQALGVAIFGSSAATGGIQTGDANINKMLQYPNNFMLSGYRGGYTIFGRATYGMNWASTAHNMGDAYRILVNESGVTPASSHMRKYYGYTVRCVLES